MYRSSFVRRSSARALAFGVLAASVTLTVPAAFTAAAEPTLVINELDADQASTDAAEFVELFDGGNGATDLTGTSLVLFNGSSDTSYQAWDLDGFSTDADGYFVLCANAATVANCDLDVSPDTDLIQNGADAAVLYTGDAATFPSGTTVSIDNIVDAVVYGTSDADDIGLLALLTASQPQVNENGGADGTIESSQRCPNGSGGARNTATFAQFAPTPGVANICQIVVPPFSCSADNTLTPISEVQGAGSASPLAGQIVTVEAVVTGSFTGLNSFYVQEDPTDADADPLTSEGILVFGRALPDGVAVGDVVQVRGAVREFTTSGGSSLTEITATGVAECDAAAAVITPTAVTLPFTTPTDLESVEGMLVALPQDLAIAESFNYDRFGEVVVSSERSLTPTAEFEPGPDAIAAAAAIELDRLTIDDGRTSQNPDPAVHPGNGGVFGLDNLFRGGDRITGITGVIDETFGLYRLQPTTYGAYTPVNARSAAPDDVGGNVKVASFNVLNYFTTLDDSGPICGPSQNVECRGADNAVELTRQRDKIVAALTAIDADIFGLIEIENNVDDAAVTDLVASLNAAAGSDTYAAIETGTIGSDAIKVALLYKSAAVSPLDAYAILDSSVDPRFIDTKSRPALAQSFTDTSSGEVFTVVVNHLKSKGSDCNDIGDIDTGDGSGNCNGTRTAAAEALVDWVATDPTASGDSDVLVIGDLNSYDKEAPIDAIIDGADDSSGTGDDYTDLVRDFVGEDAYSYVFDGQIGYLDHALANEALRSQVSGVTVWHINSDEPDALDYDTSFKQGAQDAIYAPDSYRSSDHDPVIVGLDLVDPCDTTAPIFTRRSLSPWLIAASFGRRVDVSANVSVRDDSDPNPAVRLVSVTSSDPESGNGDTTINDIVILDDTHFRLRAEIAPRRLGRLYTATYDTSDSCGNTARANAYAVVLRIPWFS